MVYYDDLMVENTILKEFVIVILIKIFIKTNIFINIVYYV